MDTLYWFALTAAAVFTGVLSSQLTARFLFERRQKALYARASEAFASMLAADCNDSSCEVHGTKPETFKN